MSHTNVKALPINDNGYSFHITAVETCLTNCMGSISCCWFLIALGADTHTHTHTHTTHTHTHMSAQKQF